MMVMSVRDILNHYFHFILRKLTCGTCTFNNKDPMDEQDGDQLPNPKWETTVQSAPGSQLLG